ncbi:hypothetical protein BN171_660003 [Clostridioides difficile E25]|nr:hypothetical protein BN171_660003 [Clostridioides difficile E25]CCL24825.1 hypothetical protein BN172_850003 [Clostridioides difficile T15]
MTFALATISLAVMLETSLCEDSNWIVALINCSFVESDFIIFPLKNFPIKKLNMFNTRLDTIMKILGCQWVIST